MDTTKLKSSLFKGLKVVLFIIVVITVITLTGRWGWIGFVVFVVVFGLFKLYIMRIFFMSQLRLIETFIWGRTLDKESWDKGEFRKTKVKITWKKKNKKKENE